MNGGGFQTAVALFMLWAAASPVLAGSGRIVTVGSAVTEIAQALGLGGHLVAVDTSSRDLPGMEQKTDIGYVRTLGAEGVLSQSPDLVLASSEAGPPEVLQQIRAAGVEVVVLNSEHDLEQIDEKILEIARSTGRESEAAPILGRFASDLEGLRNAVGLLPSRPSVVFLHARGGNNLMAAGSGTAADAMIQASGGTNACAAFQGYKPLSAESFAAMKPDFVLVSESVRGSDDDLLKSVPGLAQTPAARNKHILRVEDAAFLGFGPRSAAAARAVATRFAGP